MSRMSRRKGLFRVGLGLFVAGVVGAVLLLVLVAPGATGFWNYHYDRSLGSKNFGSLGERIYFTGTDENAREISRSGGVLGLMPKGGCADCHGYDARGRIISASITARDIRWRELTANTGALQRGVVHVPYTRGSFAKVVREGVAPEGDRFEVMPKWQMSDAQVDALIEFLNTY